MLAHHVFGLTDAVTLGAKPGAALRPLKLTSEGKQALERWLYWPEKEGGFQKMARLAGL